MTTTPTPTLAQRQAAGLRALADLIDAHPDLAEDVYYTLRKSLLGMPEFTADLADLRTRLADWARAGKAHGATITKDANGGDFELRLDFGALVLKVIAPRGQVCERVVTGVEVVTRTVPNPEALAAVPTVEVTEQVETVEWRCHPILADPQPTPAPQTAEENAR